MTAKIHAPHRMIALLALFCSSAASADDVVYRCGQGPSLRDIKVAGGEWYSKASTEDAPMTAKGCGSDRKDGSYRTLISCHFTDRILSARTSITPAGGGDGFDIDERLDIIDLKLAVWSPVGVGRPSETPCTVVGTPTLDDSGPAPSARDVAGKSLAEQIAAGHHFLIITTQESLRLKRDGWFYPNGNWVMLEGRYHSDRGLWAVSGVGFNARGNPLHSCPTEFRCGGIHEEGFRLERWYRPEDHELVAFGQTFTFDEAGDLFTDGVKVGQVLVPSI